VAGDCPPIDLIEVRTAAGGLACTGGGGVPIWHARPSLWTTQFARPFCKSALPREVMRPLLLWVTCGQGPERANENKFRMDSAMRLKPDLQWYVATAQAIVDQAASEQAVARSPSFALPSLVGLIHAQPA
jgi:hypothetical protein